MSTSEKAHLANVPVAYGTGVSIPKGLTIPTDLKVIDKKIDKIGRKHYVEYAVAVNEDRAIPAALDGCKPVGRRVLWSMYNMSLWHNAKPIKSARVTGDCFASGTLVTMANRVAIPIEDVRLDDLVLTDLGPRKVIGLFHLQDKLLYRVSTSGISVLATGDQIFYCRYSNNIEYEKTVLQLRRGDTLVTGEIVESVNEMPGTHTVYDIKVEFRHRFYANGFLVHNCMGKYHPHGSGGIYSAAVTMRNSPMPLIEGIGTWGSASSSAVAAERYTEMRLTRYAERIFFDKFYTPAMKFVPNYDGAFEEPLILPSLLPNLLLNGAEGIGVGARTNIPSFTLNSVCSVLDEVFKSPNTAPTVANLLPLEFTTLYEGKPVLNKAARKAIKVFYKTGRGSLSYRSVYTLDQKNGSILIHKFAPFSNLKKILAKVSENESDVKRINDDSDVSDKHGLVTIIFKKKLSPPDLETRAKVLIKKYFSATENYDVKVTERFIESDTGEAAARLKSTTVLEVLTSWIGARLKLEKTACTFWKGKRLEEIAYLQLLIKAVDNRSLIIKALDKKLDDDQLAEYIAKALKITVAEANKILDLKVRQLKALEKQKLLDKIKALRNEVESYDTRIAKPGPYIRKQVEDLRAQLENDRKEEDKARSLKKTRK